MGIAQYRETNNNLYHAINYNKYLRMFQIQAMIKRLVFFCVLLFLGNQSYSQEHQISAGMGVGSTSQIFDGLRSIGSAFSAMFLNSNALVNTKTVGEFRLSYAYAPKKRWTFGGTFSYNHSEFDVIARNGKIGEQVNDYYTLGAESSFYYLQKNRLRLYGLMGAGATFASATQNNFETDTHSRSNGTFFNFQVTPIGVSYGKQWGGFAELGIGYRGILSFGAYYRWN